MTPSKRRSSSTGSSGTPKDGITGTPKVGRGTTPKNGSNRTPKVGVHGSNGTPTDGSNRTPTVRSNRPPIVEVLSYRHPMSSRRVEAAVGSRTVRDSELTGKPSVQRRSHSPVSFTNRTEKENRREEKNVGSSYQRSKPSSSSGQASKPSSKRRRMVRPGALVYSRLPSQHGSGHVHQ